MEIHLISATMPKDIDTSKRFGNTVLQNYEVETVMRNIVIMQKALNQSTWTPFTFETYKEYMSHEVGNAEEGVLNVLTDGGKVPFSETRIDGGYLLREENKYTVTDKFIGIIEIFIKPGHEINIAKHPKLKDFSIIETNEEVKQFLAKLRQDWFSEKELKKKNFDLYEKVSSWKKSAPTGVRAFFAVFDEADNFAMNDSWGSFHLYECTAIKREDKSIEILMNEVYVFPH